MMPTDPPRGLPWPHARTSERALVRKAESMARAMHERARWVYALPGGDDTLALVRAELARPRHGLIAGESSERLSAFLGAKGERRLLVLDAADLAAVVVEARGVEAVPALGAVVDRAGFFAQSRLWANALAVPSPGAERALRLLAHMAVEWDADWTDVFVLHLTAPDPLVRRRSIGSLCVAAMVWGDVGVASELLTAASKRETFPKLAEMMIQALALLDAFHRGALEDALATGSTPADQAPWRGGR